MPDGHLAKMGRDRNAPRHILEDKIRSADDSVLEHTGAGALSICGLVTPPHRGIQPDPGVTLAGEALLF